MTEPFVVTYFTDPLCCWSWGLEPQMRKLKYVLKHRLTYTYVMGGLLRDWDHFEDPLNSISRPSQLGPLWMETKHITGQPINEAIWIQDPVATSYLACLAVKAAGMISFKAEEAMLRKLREAVMIHQQNIGKKDVIIAVAHQLEDKGILTFEAFEKAFSSEEAADLFKKDLNKVKLKDVTRFPTLHIQYKGKTLQITGYRPFSVLWDAFKALDPSLEDASTIDEETYINSWENLTEREIKEVQEATSPQKIGSI